MFKLIYLFLFTFIAFSANAQFKIMFVDDSGDTFGNAETLASTLDSLGYENLYIDAYGQGVSPSAADMSDYDLVIWHTSSWGAGLQFWGGGDSTNTELTQYLSQPNANFWLIGIDYFFDRYGQAPITFQAGDFAYDYLGISKYAAQSFGDDGGLGVPFVTPVPGQPITGIGDINWQFSTLWYADGFELRPEATPVYLFGGSGYVLEGAVTAAWYHAPNGARVLTYGFDLSLASDFNLMRSHVGTVLDWWQAELASGTQSPTIDLTSVNISPNTFSDRLEIRVKAQQTTPVSVRIYDATGQLITQLADQLTVQSGEEKVLYWESAAALPTGLYYCTVQSGQQVRTTKLVKQQR
jgi:hypothetical protein